jgi:hypothetical protein
LFTSDRGPNLANSVVAAGGPARVKIFIHELIELSLALTGYGLFLRRFDC